MPKFRTILLAAALTLIPTMVDITVIVKPSPFLTCILKGGKFGCVLTAPK